MSTQERMTTLCDTMNQMLFVFHILYRLYQLDTIDTYTIRQSFAQEILF